MLAAIYLFFNRTSTEKHKKKYMSLVPNCLHHHFAAVDWSWRANHTKRLNSLSACFLGNNDSLARGWLLLIVTMSFGAQVSVSNSRKEWYIKFWVIKLSRHRKLHTFCCFLKLSHKRFSHLIESLTQYHGLFKVCWSQRPCQLAKLLNM